MGRAGGGGGGGRASGGSGSRHSGGFSGGGNRGKSFGGNRGRSSFVGFGGGSSQPNEANHGFPGGGFHPMGGGTPPFSPSFGGMRHFSRAPHTETGCGCGGCLGGVMLAFMILIIMMAVLGSCSVGDVSTVRKPEITAQIQESTIQRQRLDSTSLKDVGYYTDNLEWISDSDKLEKGLRYFLKRTGVSPYLYLTENVNGNTNPTDVILDEFASQLYEELFTDEAHFLVVFQEYKGTYRVRYVCGYEARGVMDDEACEILMDYLDAYYYGDYDDETYFSKSFQDAANRIMGKKVSTTDYVAGAAVVVGLGVLVWFIWKKATAYRKPKVVDGESVSENEELLEKADTRSSQE